MLLDKTYTYSIMLHLKDNTTILLDTYTLGSDAEHYYSLMLRDKSGTRDTFRELQDISLSDMVGLSLNCTEYQYGHQKNSKCIKRNTFI